MDISNHLEKIVEGIITDISANVQAKIDDIINHTITNKLSSYNFEGYIQTAATSALEKKSR